MTDVDIDLDLDLGWEDDAGSSSDAELIAKVRAGNLRAFGALYERHVVAARRLAMLYVRNGDDADDVVADAFARVLRVLRSGSGPSHLFRAYLFTVVRNDAIQFVQQRRRYEPTDDETAFETATEAQELPEDPAVAGLERAMVSRAYNELPERWRAVLWYKEVERYTPAQIAPILDMTPNGVSALAARAREALRVGYLQQHLPELADSDCRTVNELLGKYVYGTIPGRQSAKVDAHLEVCDSCRGLVDELSHVADGMRGVSFPLAFAAGGAGNLHVGGGAAAAGGAAAGGGTAVGGGAVAGASSGFVAGASSGVVAGALASTSTTAVASAAASSVGVLAGVNVAAVASAAVVAVAGAVTVISGLSGTSAEAAVPDLAVAPVVTTASIAPVPSISAASLVSGFSAPSILPARPDLSVELTGVHDLDPRVTQSVDLHVTNTGESTAVGATVRLVFGAGVEPVDGAQVATASAESSATESSATDSSASNSSATGTAATGTAATGVAKAGTAVALVSTAPSSPATTSTTAPTAMTPTAAPTMAAALATVQPTSSPAPSTSPTAGTSTVSPAPSAGSTTPSAASTTPSLTPTATPSASPTATPSASPGVAAAVSTSTSSGTDATADPAPSCTPDEADPNAVVCRLGDVPGGETASFTVDVVAEAGGSYDITGMSWAQGLAPEPIELPALSVRHYGPELSAAAGSLDVANPGAADLPVMVENSGDQPVAAGWSVAVVLPADLVVEDVITDGLRCVADASGGNTATCTSTGAEPLAPGDSVSGALRVLAPAVATSGPATVQVVPTSGGEGRVVARSGSILVHPAWEGLSSSVATAGCERTGSLATADAVVTGTFRNTTSQVVVARLDAVGASGSTRTLGPGEAGEVTLHDGARTPAGAATWTVTTTVDGRSFQTAVAAGDLPATECSVPDWSSTTSVKVRNVGGQLQLAGTITNTSSDAMTVVLSASGQTSQPIVVESGASASITLDTGLRHLAAGTATFALSRWTADRDGDLPPASVAQPTSPATAAYPAADIAPAVGDVDETGSQASCRAAGADERARTVRVVLDNSGSTVPVAFAVGPATFAVAAGQSMTVEVPVAADQASLDVSADSVVIGSVALGAQECRWSWAQAWGSSDRGSRGSGDAKQSGAARGDANQPSSGSSGGASGDVSPSSSGSSGDADESSSGSSGDASGDVSPSSSSSSGSGRDIGGSTRGDDAGSRTDSERATTERATTGWGRSDHSDAKRVTRSGVSTRETGWSRGRVGGGHGRNG